MDSLAYTTHTHTLGVICQKNHRAPSLGQKGKGNKKAPPPPSTARTTTTSTNTYCMLLFSDLHCAQLRIPSLTPSIPPFIIYIYFFLAVSLPPTQRVQLPLLPSPPSHQVMYGALCVCVCICLRLTPMCRVVCRSNRQRPLSTRTGD